MTDESHEPNLKLRILIIGKNLKLLSGHINFLRQHNYEVVSNGSLIDGLKLIYDFKPHCVLLSWNLDGVNIRKTYQVLVKKLKIKCIVFSENTVSRGAVSLLSSGIPNIILPPVTGSSMHHRIKKLLRRNENRYENERLRGNLNLEGKIKLKPLKEDPDAPEKKQKDFAKSESENDDAIMYREKSKALGPDKVFFIKGDEEKDQQRGKNDFGSTVLGDNGPEEEDGDLGKIIGEPNYKDLSIKDLTSLIFDDADEEVPVGTVSLIEEEEKQSFNDKNRKNITLSDTVKNVCEDVLGPIDGLFTENLKDTKIVAFVIKTATAMGYLVFCNNSNFVNPIVIENISNGLKKNMAKAEQPVESLEVLKFEVSELEIADWVKKNKKGFAFETGPKENRTLVAFLPVNYIPKPEIVVTTDKMKIELETDIFAEAKLLFDVFLHLPINEKYIHYFRNAGVMPQKTIERLIGSGVTSVFIRADQTTDFKIYFAIHTLMQTRKKSGMALALSKVS